MLSVEIDERFAKAIDKVIEQTGAYSSRSEFLKDSIRKNFEEMLKMDADLRSIHEGAKKLAEIAKSRGYKGGLLTRKEKDKIAREYLKKKGIM
jgi:Arc/MetJ-type ribon-helix-helix transcriptional regulator